MADRLAVIACPLCAGRGEVLPQALVDLFSNPELRKRFDARMEEIAALCKSVGATGTGDVLDFQKEVHAWNPTLPIWRRSPKE